jgi:hypothetical protein
VYVRYYFGIVWKENIIRTENINKSAFYCYFKRLCKLYNRGWKHHSRIYVVTKGNVWLFWLYYTYAIYKLNWIHHSKRFFFKCAIYLKYINTGKEFRTNCQYVTAIMFQTNFNLTNFNLSTISFVSTQLFSPEIDLQQHTT